MTLTWTLFLSTRIHVRITTHGRRVHLRHHLDLAPVCGSLRREIDLMPISVVGLLFHRVRTIFQGHLLQLLVDHLLIAGSVQILHIGPWLTVCPSDAQS